MATDELTLEDIGIEFELIAANLQAIGHDLRTGEIEPRAAIEELADQFKGLRFEYEVLTRKVDSDA